jgi:hypothetical protein
MDTFTQTKARARVEFHSLKGASFFAQARNTIRALFDSAPYDGRLILEMEYVGGRLQEAVTRTKWTNKTTFETITDIRKRERDDVMEADTPEADTPVSQDAQSAEGGEND